MMNPSDGYAYRQSVRRFLYLDGDRPVEIHLANGHVVAGPVVNVLWEARGEFVSAVEVKERLPDGTQYSRILMWDHVVEVRPSIEEAPL